ncbi:hypothetical protein [Pseudomonas sp. CP4]|uniref:hypothetical protein n=1 Tax=Pseudomonas sp. CP4 TaxID=3388844 RepID=UPI0039EE365B
MSTTGKLSVIRSIDSTEVENWTTDFVTMELGAFAASTKGRPPSVTIFYGEALEDKFHNLNLDPATGTKLEYVSAEGKTFSATGTVKVTVSGYQSQQVGEIDAILTDTDGRNFQLKGTYDGKKPL